MILATFSLDWFMTIPGMLITGGVLFLMIALIIFIVTGNKKTKTKKEVVEAQDASKQEAAVAATPIVGQSTVATNEQAVTPQVQPSPQPVITNEPVMPSPVSSMAEKTVTQEIEPAVFTATLPQDVTPQPTFNSQVSNPVGQSIPVVNPTVTENVNTVVPPVVSTQTQVVQTPVVPTIEQTPIVNQPVTPEITVKEEKKEVMQTPSFDMPRPIYGGVSPVVPTVSHEEEHRPIYGGANPLENTQSVPIVPPRPVATKEVKVDIPTVEIPAVPVTPSVTQQVSNDIFASSSVPTTHVNANPVVEPKVAVQPTQPTASQSQPEEIESLF